MLDDCFACSWLAVLLRKPNLSLRKPVFSPPPPHSLGGCFDGYSAGGVVFAAGLLTLAR